MAKLFGIEFAPLNIPLERRLQTASIVFLMFLFFASPVVGTMLYVYLFFTKYYYVALLYTTWLWYDRNCCHRGGRRLTFPRRLRIWKYAGDYFPNQLIKTADLDPIRNYIFACHPHGQSCTGTMLTLGYDPDFMKVFPGIKATAFTLTLHFFWPFIRDIILSFGVCSASKESIAFKLNKCGTGNALCIVCGGSAEAIESHPGTAVLLLKRRKGFICLALKHGVPVVPIYTFGETDLFSQVPNPEGSLVRKIQTKFKDIFRIPLFLINGRGIFQYTFGILPRRHPLVTVVGKPIEFGKIENPSEEIVNECHAKYMESLRQLFDEYKVKLGGDFKDQVLVIK